MGIWEYGSMGVWEYGSMGVLIQSFFACNYYFGQNGHYFI